MFRMTLNFMHSNIDRNMVNIIDCMSRQVIMMMLNNILLFWGGGKRISISCSTMLNLSSQSLQTSYIWSCLKSACILEFTIFNFNCWSMTLQ